MDSPRANPSALECYVVLRNIESGVKSSVQQHLTPSALV